MREIGEKMRSSNWSPQPIRSLPYTSCLHSPKVSFRMYYTNKKCAIYYHFKCKMLCKIMYLSQLAAAQLFDHSSKQLMTSPLWSLFLHFLFTEKCRTFSGSDISATVRCKKCQTIVTSQWITTASVNHYQDQSLRFSGSDTESAVVGEAESITICDNNVVFFGGCLFFIWFSQKYCLIFKAIPAWDWEVIYFQLTKGL